MKKKLRKVIVPIFLSIMCGAVCGRLVYSIYDKKLEKEINGEKIYLIQAGTYSSYDNMVNSMLLGSYVYYEDDGIYKSIVGLTEEYSNIEKIKNTYKDAVVINEYFSKDEELNKKIKEYDEKIKKSTKEEEIKRIVIEMLAIYKDRNATLIEIQS